MKEYGATLIITIGVITLLTTGVFSGAIYSFVCRVVKEFIDDVLSRLYTQLNEMHEKYCEAERLTCTRKCSKRRTGSELISFKLEQVSMTAWQEEQKRIEENTKAVEKANEEAAESVEAPVEFGSNIDVETSTVLFSVMSNGKPWKAVQFDVKLIKELGFSEEEIGEADMQIAHDLDALFIRHPNHPLVKVSQSGAEWVDPEQSAESVNLFTKDYLREIEEDVENYHPEHTNDQKAIDRDFMQEISTVVENVAKSTDLPFNDDEDNNNELKE
jgi:hypothetical protein